MIGERFGRLLVQSESAPRNSIRHFACLCDCGVEKVVAENNLASGRQRSCGCLRREVSAAQDPEVRRARALALDGTTSVMHRGREVGLKTFAREVGLPYMTALDRARRRGFAGQKLVPAKNLMIGGWQWRCLAPLTPKANAS